MKISLLPSCSKMFREFGVYGWNIILARRSLVQPKCCASHVSVSLVRVCSVLNCAGQATDAFSVASASRAMRRHADGHLRRSHARRGEGVRANS